MTAESEAFGARSEIRETVIGALETIAQTQTLMAQVNAGSPEAGVLNTMGMIIPTSLMSRFRAFLV